MATREYMPNHNTFFLKMNNTRTRLCVDRNDAMCKYTLKISVGLAPDHSNKVSHNLFAGTGLCFQFVKEKMQRLKNTIK